MKTPDVVFDPRDPQFEHRTREMFYAMPFVRFLGMEIVALGPGWLDCEVVMRKEITQQHGFGHAGLVGTLIDMSAGMACVTLLEPSQDALSCSINISLLRPSRGEKLIARGRVIKAGRTQSYAEAWVYGATAGKETLVARGQVTIAILGESPAKMHKI